MRNLKQIENELLARYKNDPELITLSEPAAKAAIHSAYIKALEEMSISAHSSLIFADPKGNEKYARCRTIILSIVALVESGYITNGETRTNRTMIL